MGYEAMSPGKWVLALRRNICLRLQGPSSEQIKKANEYLLTIGNEGIKLVRSVGTNTESHDPQNCIISNTAVRNLNLTKRWLTKRRPTCILLHKSDLHLNFTQLYSLCYS